MTVRFRDGSSRALDLSRLREVTVRDEGRRPELDRIASVNVGLPIELLRSFRLVDTPGLGSVHSTDSHNTAEFLRIGGSFTTQESDELRKSLAAAGCTATAVAADSRSELDRADAVVYLFSRGLHVEETRTVEQFLGTVPGLTPLKVFGVLSRCDQFWPPAADLSGAADARTYDPMAAATTIVERYLERRDVRRLFYTVVPVAALVAEGASGLTATQWDDLALLSTVAPDRLCRALRDTNRFARADELPGVPLPPTKRADLVGQLSAWGVHLACEYLRDGLSPDTVRTHLIERSGIARLRDLVVRHFGNRSALLKADGAVQEARAEIRRLRLEAQLAGRPVPAVVEDLAGRLETLHATMPGFGEMDVLAQYYNGRLCLSPEEERDLLRLTGESGVSCAARVGLPEDAAPSLVEQRAAHLAAMWAVRELDPTTDRRTAVAVRTVRAGFDRIRLRAWQARLLLADAHLLDQTALPVPAGAPTESGHRPEHVHSPSTREQGTARERL